MNNPFKKEPIKQPPKKTWREFLEEYIVFLLNFHAHRLKPSVMNKIDLRIEREWRLISKDKTKAANATYTIKTKPGLITVYTPNLTECILKLIDDNIIELLRHEITHSTGILDEEECAKIERTLDIFKKDKKKICPK